MNQQILTALRALSQQCDGAESEDQRGFNKPDSHRCKYWATLDDLTPGQAFDAWQRLRKYTAQLAALGIDYNAIPAPPSTDLRASDLMRPVVARNHTKDSETRIIRTDEHKQSFTLAWPYRDVKLLLEKMRDFFPLRSYSREPFPHWRVPATPQAARLMEFALEFEFEISEEACALFDSITIEPEDTTKPTPKHSSRKIQCDIDKKGKEAVGIYFDYVPAIHAGVKNLEGAQFHDAQPKHWTCKYESAAEVLKLAEGFDFQVTGECRVRLEQAVQKAVEATTQTKRRALALLEAAKDIPTGSFGGKTPREYQVAGVSFLINAGGGILADDMGCISGNAMLRLNRGGAGFQMTLRELYKKFNRLEGRWKPAHLTKVKSMAGDGLLYHNIIKKVIYQGIKQTFEITTASGKKLRATSDHLFATPDGWWRLESLRPGDTILTNGIAACLDCRSTEGVATYAYAKFKGYCRKCIYSKLRVDGNYKRGWFEDPDGYIRVSSQQGHPRANKQGQVYQHILVMENAIGRHIGTDETVHHKNERRNDNRLENLELMTVSEHARHHSAEKKKHLSRDRHGNEIIWQAREDVITSIEPYGEEDVYDLVMDDPSRNFVASGMIVHNCGKTFEAALWARCYQRAFSAHIFIVCPVSLMDGWRKEAEACSIKCEVFSWAKVPKPVGSPFVVIADEAHYAQSLKSQRTKAMLELTASPNCLGVVLASGTPMRGGRPANLFPLLKAVKHPIANRQKDYEKTYCNARFKDIGRGRQVWDTTGAAHLDDLMRQIKDVFLRRTKDQVLKDLPAKSLVIKPIEISADGQAIYKKAFDEAQLRYQQKRLATEQRIREAESKGKVYEFTKEDAQEGGEELVLLTHLRRAASLAKAEPAIELADEILEQGRSVILFTEFADSAKAIAANYRKAGIQTELLTGETKPEDRQPMVDRFQSGQSRVWISTIKAGGVGLTLTAASDVILIDQSWMIDDCQQAGDRAHRIGQKNAVTVYWLRGFDVDEKIQARLIEQENALKSVMAGDRSTMRGVKSINQLAAEIARELFSEGK